MIIQLLCTYQEYQKNDKKIVAVEGTTMDLYEGQISALLGQNGAGKTTSMNMIVGALVSISINSIALSYNSAKTVANKINLLLLFYLYYFLCTTFLKNLQDVILYLIGLTEPTSGYVMVGKHNVLRDLDKVKKSLGICPQFNCLFDLLTVEEHLEFYSKVNMLVSLKILLI